MSAMRIHLGGKTVRILKVDPLNPEDDILKIASDMIKNGKIVAFPTETVYGLGADAFNPSAVEKIFRIKKRPTGNPLIVHISKIEHVNELVEDLDIRRMKVLERLWPGPITFVLKKRSNLPDIVTGGLNTVAVRMPSHPVSVALIDMTGPIVAPSANLSGRPSPTKAQHVIDDFKDELDAIVDGGETIFGLESSVIDLSGDHPILIRPGPITFERLRNIFPDLVIDVDKIPSSSFDHYMTKKPLYLFIGTVEKIVKSILSFVEKRKKNFVLLCSEETKNMYPDNFRKVIMGSRVRPFSIAKRIFDIMRKVDKMDVDEILVEGIEEKGIGFTVMDRLRRSALRIFE